MHVVKITGKMWVFIKNTDGYPFSDEAVEVCIYYIYYVDNFNKANHDAILTLNNKIK